MALLEAVSQRQQALGASVKLTDVSRRFGGIQALRGITLSVSPGELLVVTGRSGSGKSTLLNLIGGLDHPDTGAIQIDGAPIWESSRARRARRQLVGFVFQQHLLMPELSARANIEVPLVGGGIPRPVRRQRAAELLAEVGLSNRAEHRPAMLSGGERQRVALARALANGPRLLLADEPTGALDSATSRRIVELLVRLQARHGMTLIVVSYDPQVRDRADRVLSLSDGQITAVEPPTPTPG